MALDPGIIGGVKATPNQTPDQAAEGVEKQTAALDTARQTIQNARDDAAVRQAFANAGPGADPFDVAKSLEPIAPGAAMKLKTAVLAQQKDMVEIQSKDLANRTATATMASQAASYAQQHPEAYPTIKPQLEGLLGHKLSDQYNPDEIGLYVNSGEEAKDRLKQEEVNLTAVKDMQAGQASARTTASTVLSSATDANDWNQKLAHLATLMTPDQRGVLSEFGQYDANATKRASDLGLTPDEKVKAAQAKAVSDREAAAEASLEAYRRSELGIRQGELAVTQAREAREGGNGAALGSGKAQDPNAPHGDDYLKTLPQNEASTVKALAEGRIPWPTGSALRAGPWSARVDEALQYDPTLDTATISNNARQKVRNDFTSGKSAQTVNAMNTVVGHLANLQEIGTHLGNTSSDWVNEAKNWLTLGGSKTGVAINNFNTAKQAVADELTRVYRQAGGSEADIQSWQSTINAAKSPQELKGAFKTIGGLLESKLGAMQDQYQQGMGTTPVGVIAPQGFAKLNTMQTGRETKVTPNGLNVIEKQVDGSWKVIR